MDRQGTTEIVEIVSYRLAEGVTRGRFLAASDTLGAWVRGRDGFVSREVLANEAGDWVEVVRWRSVAAAKATEAAAMQAPDVCELFGLIDHGTVRMLHVEAAA